jgi:hypothetical protein
MYFDGLGKTFAIGLIVIVLATVLITLGGVWLVQFFT